VRGRDHLTAAKPRRSSTIYLAGPLFTVAERDFNASLAARLEALGHRVFLPQRDVPVARGRHRTRRLYERCLHGLRSADVVVAVCDGPTADDGTAWEIGYAVAAGKVVYALRTDRRWVARDEHVNLMIQHSVAALVRTVPRLLATLAR
jgi:nucleoside 2-deoxyribosyltransferase